MKRRVKDRAMEIINYEDQEMIPLIDEKIKFYEEQKECHVCKKEFSYDENDKNKFKLYQEVRDHCITPENLEQPLIVSAIYNTKYLKKFL